MLVTNLGDPRGMATLLDRALALDAGNTQARAYLTRVSALLDEPPAPRRQTPRVTTLQSRRGESR